MGGSLFASIGARRHTTAEIEAMKPKIETMLKDFGLRFAYPHEFADKADHGDLDILVSFDNLEHKAKIDKLIEPLDSFEQNGLVTSILIDELQVDLIFVRAEHFEFAVQYYSWGDLGNIVGLYARTVGLKVGEHGLYMETNVPQYGIARSYLTFDFADLLSGFGLSYKTYREGFESFTDVMEFFKQSPIVPVLSNLNSSARRRLRKRPNQIVFHEAVMRGDFGVVEKEQLYGKEAPRFTPSEVQDFISMIDTIDTHSHACVYKATALASKSITNKYPNIMLGKNNDGSYYLTYGHIYQRLETMSELVETIKQAQ